MLPLAASDLPTALVNASMRERKALTLPADFDVTDWSKLDYFGWRDPKLPAVGYVIVELDDGPAGVMLRQADGSARARPQCSWCEDVTLPNDVVLFSAKRSGQAGRNGNTTGILACAGFECSANVRRRAPVAYLGFDVEAARLQRIQALGEHVRRFVGNVRDGN